MINADGMSDKKILLVDDEEEIVNLLETVLLKEGFKNIFKAHTGVDAVECCKENNPDIRGTNTGEAHKGSGLGMAISKQIIEAHNGQIKVNSILGEGTTINISM